MTHEEMLRKMEERSREVRDTLREHLWYSIENFLCWVLFSMAIVSVVVAIVLLIK